MNINKKYWGYRIGKSNFKFFQSELENNRLRQGWGYNERQNLTNLSFDGGARRNLPMFRKVKKGDILLVPNIPNLNQVSIVEATEDWDKAYKFEISNKFGDYGHIFPAKIIKSFIRNNKNVTGNLRSTLKNPSRFWNINHYSDDIETLINNNNLLSSQNYSDRFNNSIENVFIDNFNEEKFSNDIYNKLNEQFSREEWEFALINGLQKLFPFYHIERTGGKEEKKHGTDILIKLPSLQKSYEYGIAIQVKDYSGFVSNKVIEQINKADDYWNNENLKLIEKIVIVTKSGKNENEKLSNNDSNVRIIFANDLKELLNQIAQNYIGLKVNL